MDPLFVALSLLRRRKHTECINVCSEELEKNPYDQAFWLLKMRCLTSEVYIDDIEADEEGIAEQMMDENAIATVAKPGTSLRAPLSTGATTSSQSMRPMTQSGRPLTGVLRPGTQSSGGSMDNALRASRTAKSARPMSSQSGRYVRLGTASMLSQSDGPFINLSRLNTNKYAALNGISKSLFEYILFVENNVRLALELAATATQFNQFKDWYWKMALGKCYYKVGMLRDAEQQFRSILKNHQQQCTVDVYVWLGKIYLRLDQPSAALELYQQGITQFSGETFLMIHSARIHEQLFQMDEAYKLYKNVSQYEAINIEAIACIALHHFYNDQPEIALRYYRRILQMGTQNAETYNNIGLCCYYSQQFDMSITCFEKALTLASDNDLVADVWYNIGHISLASGDKQLAMQAFRLTLVANNEHAEAYNNLGVLEMSKSDSLTTNGIHQARTFFETAANAGKHLYEPFYNLALIGEKSGCYDLSYKNIKKALEIYPQHYASKQILEKIKRIYETV